MGGGFPEKAGITGSWFPQSAGHRQGSVCPEEQAEAGDASWSPKGTSPGDDLQLWKAPERAGGKCSAQESHRPGVLWPLLAKPSDLSEMKMMWP